MIEVRNLKKHYRLSGSQRSAVPSQTVKAVDGVSFTINAGETLGLVGESGSGKSTLGQMLLMQTLPTEGSILFEGIDIRDLLKDYKRNLMGKVQVVFQDPYDQLNPRMRVKEIIEEPLRNLKVFSNQEIKEKIKAVIERVGLRTEDLQKYPHQFSGGQRQRIGIARAISVNPKFIVLDEPVSALDVSVQAQVINLLIEIQAAHQLTYLFISHNLAIVEHVSDRIAILYLGKIVEVLRTDELQHARLHPYTRALIDSIPVPDPTRVKLRSPLAGEIPDPMNLPAGCRFNPRCAYAQKACLEQEPQLLEVETGHWMACHRYHELTTTE